MKHFFRTVLFSLRYKWSIVAAVLCSIMIALLWSASISSIYPIAQLVLIEQGTVSDFFDRKIEDHQRAVAQLQAEVQQRQLPESQRPAKQTQLNYELSQLRFWTELRPKVVPYAPNTPFQTLVWVVVFVLGTTAIRGVFLIFNTVLVARVANRTVYDMRRIYFRRALAIDQSMVDKHGTSKLMTNLSSNMIKISGGLMAFYGRAIREPLKMIACLAVAAWISLPLLLISLMLAPLGAVLIGGLARRMKNATLKEIGGMSQIFQSLIDSFGGIKTIRMFNREATERRRFKRNAGTIYKMVLRMNFFDSLIRPITELLGIASISIAMLAGAYLVLNGETHLLGFRILKTRMDPGMLLLFYAMIAGASEPAKKITEIVNRIIRAGTACELLSTNFETPPKIAAPENPVDVPLHSQSIEFSGVTFLYAPKQPVLRRLDLTIPYGQTLAIVGGNGSGKSTIANLLARFYDVNYGTIRIDGVDIRDVRPRKLRQQMAWVTQDARLLKGTVRENILYGNLRATEDSFHAAARIAGVDQFLKDLPKGWDTEIGDGGCLLSAGQRQRVAIARAIIADPRILILDEATSQMDGKTEQLVHDNLTDFIKQRTTIIITHRASSLKLADRVVVMENGRIIGDSTPDRASREVPSFKFLFARSA